MSSIAFAPTLIQVRPSSSVTRTTCTTHAIVAHPIAHPVLPRPLPEPRRARLAPLFPPAPPAAPAKHTRILLWLHADLRVHDNAALMAAHRAAASSPTGALLPLCVDTIPRVRPLVAELAHALRALGSDLANVSGTPARVLPDLCKRLGLTAVFFNSAAIVGPLWHAQRAAARALRAAGLHVREFHPNILPLSKSVADGKVFTMAKVRSDIQVGSATTHEQPPNRMASLPSGVDSIKQIALPANTHAGTSAAINLLSKMTKSDELNRTRRSAHLAFRLKLHLDYGTVSARFVAANILKVVNILCGTTYHELLWRTFVGTHAVRLASSSSKVHA